MTKVYYNLFPDNDKYQVDGNSITATSTNVDGGSVAHLGSLDAGSVITDKTEFGHAPSGKDIYGSLVRQSSFVWGVFETSAITITSVNLDATTGNCDFTLTAHGLSVGDVIAVRGATANSLNRMHTVKSLPDANSFVTDVPYVISGTAGNYTKVRGRFASMTAGEWVMRGGVSTDVAESGLISNQFGNLGTKRSIHFIESIRTVRVATAIRAGYWHIYEGTWTTAPTEAQDSFGQDDAARPSYAVPGELTYRTSGQPDGTGGGITSDEYKPKTA